MQWAHFYLHVHTVNSFFKKFQNNLNYLKNSIDRVCQVLLNSHFFIIINIVVCKLSNNIISTDI